MKDWEQVEKSRFSPEKCDKKRVGMGRAQRGKSRNPGPVAKILASAFQCLTTFFYLSSSSDFNNFFKNYNSSSNLSILWYFGKCLTTGFLIRIEVPAFVSFASFCHVNTSCMANFSYQPEVTEDRVGKTCGS